VLSILVPPSLGNAKAEARAELLSETLTRELGETTVAKVAANYAEIADGLESGKVSLAWAPSAVCAGLVTARGVFTIVRDGRASYRSALVARREDGLSTAKLVGKKAAWVDPLSAGGYLLAVAHLRSRGLDPDATFASQLFLGSHRAAALAVVHHEADVAAVSAHWLDDATMAADLRWYVGPAGDKLEAIALSDRCPNDAVVIASAVGEALATRLRACFLDQGKASRELTAALEASAFQEGDLGAYRAAFNPSAIRNSSLRPPVK
jgi:phosphonate transport system substrate-binding protein